MTLRDDLAKNLEEQVGLYPDTAAETADAVMAWLRRRGKELKPNACVMTTVGFGWTGLQAHITRPALLIDWEG